MNEVTKKDDKFFSLFFRLLRFELYKISVKPRSSFGCRYIELIMFWIEPELTTGLKAYIFLVIPREVDSVCKIEIEITRRSLPESF